MDTDYIIIIIVQEQQHILFSIDAHWAVSATMNEDQCEDDDSLLNCSPLSSTWSTSPDRTGKNRIEEDEEALLALFNQARSDGGYGGFLRYSEFAELTKSIDWTEDVSDDCWYEIVDGVAMSTATDMGRVVEKLHCYGAKLSYINGGNPSSQMLLSLIQSRTRQRDAMLGHHHRPSSPPTARGAVGTSEQDSSANAVNTRDTIHTTISQPGSASYTCCTSPTLAGDTALPGACAESTQTVHSPERWRGMRRDARIVAGKRYVMQTAASEAKQRRGLEKKTKQTPSHGVNAVRSVPAHDSACSSKEDDHTDKTKASNACLRLYRCAQQRERARTDAGERARPARYIDTLRATTSAHGSDPSARPPSSPPLTQGAISCIGRRHFCVPTESFYARLTAAPEVHYDGIDNAPATPLVPIQPAPGPSTFVPRGYVDVVARLRRSIGATKNTDFVETLRGNGSVRGKASAVHGRGNDVTNAPILRIRTPRDDTTRPAYIDIRLKTN